MDRRMYMKTKTNLSDSNMYSALKCNSINKLLKNLKNILKRL